METKFPGPQQYDISKTYLDKQGSYFISTFKNSGPAKINPTHSPHRNKLDAPGPAH